MVICGSLSFISSVLEEQIVVDIIFVNKILKQLGYKLSYSKKKMVLS